METNPPEALKSNKRWVWTLVLQNSNKMGSLGKYSSVLYISLCLQINGLQSQNCSMRHQPQRLEKERVVSHFWGSEHLVGGQKIHVPRGPRVSNECFYSSSVLSQPFRQPDPGHKVPAHNLYHFTICSGVRRRVLQRAHGDSGNSPDSFCDNTFPWGLRLNQLLLKPTVGL